MNKKVNTKDQFTEAYLEYYPLAYNIIYAKLGNIDETEDICQEVFLLHHKKIAEVENIRKWIYGVFRNLLFRHFDNLKKERYR